MSPGVPSGMPDGLASAATRRKSASCVGLPRCAGDIDDWSGSKPTTCRQPGVRGILTVLTRRRTCGGVDDMSDAGNADGTVVVVGVVVDDAGIRVIDEVDPSFLAT